MTAKYDFLIKSYISLAAILEIAPYDPDGHGNSPGDKSNIECYVKTFLKSWFWRIMGGTGGA